MGKGLMELYQELLENPTYFCGEENYRYQLQVREFKGLPPLPTAGPVRE
ncbi:hypothetical protein [Thermococcus peptonophilus]